MKAVRLASFVLITVLLPFFVFGCTEKYDYPDGLTNEYFYTNYVQMDYNYMFSSIYENAASKNPYRTSPGNYSFYAIRDVSIDDYIACKYWFGGVGSTSKYMVYAGTESQSDLIGTYGINRMSIILKSRLDDDAIDAIKSYEKSTVAKELNSVAETPLFDALQENITNKKEYITRELGDLCPGEVLYCTDEEYVNTLLCVRLYSPATDNIFWESNVVLYEGRYCLASYRGSGRNYYDVIPLSNEVSDYIKNVVEQSGYSFVYERIDQ